MPVGTVPTRELPVQWEYSRFNDHPESLRTPDIDNGCMPLKIATVFSGIGAIEHALERMGIEHEVVFACDNSNIDWSEILTKTTKMVQLLQALDDAGATVSGIKKLASCWEEDCCSTENLQRKYIQLDLKEKELIRLENITLRCSDCLVDDNSRRLKTQKIQSKPQIGFIRSHGFVKREKRKFGFRRLGFNSSQSRVVITEVSAPRTPPNLNDVLRNAIMSINSQEIRREMVNKLYDTRGKKAFVEESYLANYDVADGHFHKDITFVDGKPYKNQVDLFVGGSPCQSFSFVGHQGGFDDARGTLFYDFVRLVDDIQPKMFIWENVKGVYTHDKGKTWEVISKCFDTTGYTWHHQVLNSKDYGIPQHRQRVFVVGFRNGGEGFEFPEPTELKTTMQDFLEDQVAGKYFLNTKGVDFVTWEKNHRKQYTQIDGEIMLCQKANQQFNWHGDFVFVEENKGQHIVDEKHFLSQKVRKYVLASGTKGFSSKPETDLEIARPLLATLFKNHRAGVDNYVTTDGRLRMLTPTECLRLMGFCDSFKQVVSNVQLYRQAGNSIVVDVLIAIMAQAIPELVAADNSFSNLQERAMKVRELFDELPEKQIQQSDLQRIVAALIV